MSGLVKLSVIAVICLLIASCNLPAQNPDNPSPPPEEKVVPTLPIDLSGAQATLTIIRTMRVAMGEVTISAAIPLFFAIDEKNPEDPVILWGTGTGTASMNGVVSGTGGSYTVEGEWPVDYDVKGNLYPSREVCKITLSVDEFLLLSKEVMVHADPLGDVLSSGGEDEFTTFPNLNFTEILSEVKLEAGSVESTFSIDDWCLPKSTFCTYGCPP